MRALVLFADDEEMVQLSGQHARQQRQAGLGEVLGAAGNTVNMPVRFWVILVLSLLAGIAVLLVKPTGRKPRSSVPWRGRI